MGLVRADNVKMAAIVSTLKSKPPINFNVALKTHAMNLGVHLHTIAYNGPKVTLHASSKFNFDQIRSFARSLPSKFPHVLGTTTLAKSALQAPAPVSDKFRL
jgi:hypothetical protein